MRGQMLLPARPDKLYGAAKLFGDNGGFNRVIVFQAAVKTTACGHGIKYDICCANADGTGGRLTRAFWRLACQP